jgi:hypothetical protein
MLVVWLQIDASFQGVNQWDNGLRAPKKTSSKTSICLPTLKISGKNGEGRSDSTKTSTNCCFFL